MHSEVEYIKSNLMIAPSLVVVLRFYWDLLPLLVPWVLRAF